MHDAEHIDRHQIVFSFLELQIIDEGIEFTHQNGVQSGVGRIVKRFRGHSRRQGGKDQGTYKGGF